MKSTSDQEAAQGPPVCWYLYVIRTVDGSLYTGISTDVARRFGEHLVQGRKTARYLRARKPLHLAFSQAIGDRPLALRVENRFRRLPKGRKEQVVASGRLCYDHDTGIIVFPQGCNDAIAPAPHFRHTGSRRTFEKNLPR